MLKSDYASQAVQTGHVITASHQPEILQGFDRKLDVIPGGLPTLRGSSVDRPKTSLKSVLELFYHSVTHGR